MNRTTDNPLPADVLVLLTEIVRAIPDTLADSLDELIDEVIGEVSNTTVEAALAGDESDDEFENRIERQEQQLRELIEPYAGMLAVRPRSAGWSLFVPSGVWTGSGLETEGAIHIVGEDGSAVRSTWAEVRNNPDFWLAQGAALFGVCWENAEDFPFAFDGESWEGTSYDFNYGGDWELQQDNTEYVVHLSDVSLRYRSSSGVDAAKVGDWLSVDVGGTSMTTGDIGFTVSMDDNGGFWSYEWGCRRTYVGRLSMDFGPEDALGIASANADGAVLYDESVASISSEVFGPAAMWVVIQELLGEVPDDDRLDELEVDCVGFTGSGRELAVELGHAIDDDDEDVDDDDEDEDENDDDDDDDVSEERPQ